MARASQGIINSDIVINLELSERHHIAAGSVYNRCSLTEDYRGRMSTRKGIVMVVREIT